MPDKYLSIGQISRRSGIPISTLHFYERKGLIISERNAANPEDHLGQDGSGARLL